MRRRALLMGGKVEPNTIIGGVGGTITTKSALATKLGISESIIKRFEVIGSDVYARISEDYEIQQQAFLNDTNITFYNDIGGKATSLRPGSFNGCTNLLEVYLPELVSSSPGTTLFRYCYNLHTAYLPKINNLRNQCFEDNYELINLVTDGCVEVSTSTFYDCTALPSLYLPSLTTVFDKNSTFRNLTSCEIISMRKLTTLGSLANVNNPQNCFVGLKLNCEIEVNIALATDNSGNANAALQWAKDNRSATVRFYDNAGNYVSTL